MDLLTNNFFDEENAMLFRFVDPLVHQTVVPVVPNVTLNNEIDDFFTAVDESTTKSSVENNSIIPNDRTSFGTSVTTYESELTAEVESMQWTIDELPLFPDLQYLFHNLQTANENNPQISTTHEEQISCRSTQLPCVDDFITISDDEIDAPQIPTTNEVQQQTTSTEPSPTVELIIKPPQLEGRRLHKPHKYNTRRTAYKKKLSDFITQEQELLKILRNNQQPPTAQDASTPHGQWLHSKDFVHINLLRVDILIKKVPNYSLTKSYKTRKARSKKVSVTSTTTSSDVC